MAYEIIDKTILGTAAGSGDLEWDGGGTISGTWADLGDGNFAWYPSDAHHSCALTSYTLVNSATETFFLLVWMHNADADSAGDYTAFGADAISEQECAIGIGVNGGNWRAYINNSSGGITTSGQRSGYETVIRSQNEASGSQKRAIGRDGAATMSGGGSVGLITVDTFNCRRNAAAALDWRIVGAAVGKLTGDSTAQTASFDSLRDDPAQIWAGGGGGGTVPVIMAHLREQGIS